MQERVRRERGLERLEGGDERACQTDRSAPMAMLGGS